MDIADVFAQYAATVSGGRRAQWFSGLATAARSRRTEAVVEGCWSDDGLSEGLIRDLAESDAGIWEILVGIDRAVGRLVRGGAQSLPVDMGVLGWRLKDKGVLTDLASADHGVVLVKGGWCGLLPKNDTFDECFESLTWVSPSVWGRINFRHLRRSEDFWAGGVDESLRIGCVPFVNSIDELSIEARDERDRRWYEVRPRSALTRRLEATLEGLDRSGCHIGLLPESCLDDALLDQWRDLVLSTARPIDDGSVLRWIVLGSGPVGQRAGWPPNRLIVIDRDTGEQVASHDKNNPYTMTDEDVRSLGLESLLPGPLGEYMDEGTTIDVVSSRFGRIVFEICEDLDRTEDNLSVLRSLRPHLLLVSVLSSYLVDHETQRPYWKWEAQRAHQHSTKVGCATVVCTSLVFPRQAYRGKVLPKSIVTSILFPPARGSRSVSPDEGWNAWEPTSVHVHELPAS